jgi:hypothetical protein
LRRGIAGKEGLGRLVGHFVPCSLGEHRADEDLEGCLSGVPVPGFGAVDIAEGI